MVGVRTAVDMVAPEIQDWLQSMLSSMAQQNENKLQPKRKFTLQEVIHDLSCRGFELSILESCVPTITKQGVCEAHRQAREFIKNPDAKFSIWISLNIGPKEYLCHDIAIRYTIKTGLSARYIHARDAVVVMRHGEHVCSSQYVNQGKLLSTSLLFICGAESVDRGNICVLEYLVYSRIMSGKKTVLLCNTEDAGKLVEDIGCHLTAWAGEYIYQIEDTPCMK